jgi:hypothetical protein
MRNEQTIEMKDKQTNNNKRMMKGTNNEQVMKE